MTTESGSHGLRIHRLTASNVKRLRAVDITPDRNAVVIGGGNEQGKSSVLDSIAMAIGGGREVPVEVLRRGEKRGHVTIDLGDFKLTRTWKRNDNGRLKIEAGAGVKAPTTQKLLDKLYERIAFDPFAWALKGRTGPGQKEQREDLIRIAKLPIDLEGNMRDRAARYAERREVGRERDALKARAEAIPEPPEGTPDEAVDVGELVVDFQEAVRRNSEHRALLRDVDEAARHLQRAEEIVEQEKASRAARLADMEREYAAWLEEVEREKKRRERAIKEFKDAGPAAIGTKIEAVERAQKALEEAREAADEAPEVVDTEAIKERIDTAKETNARVAQKRDKRELQAAHEKTAEQYEYLSAEIEKLDAERTTALENAELPIPGLGFDDDGVTLDGIPFNQLAQSVRLRISVAMAMALNRPENGGPNLRVMLVRDGALLDEEHLAMLIAMCKEKDYQVWIETVGENAQCSIVMEDGAVRGEEE